MIKSLSLCSLSGLKVELKAYIYAVYQQDAEWKTEGSYGIAHEKKKNSQAERTMLIIWYYANSWPQISLGWKFRRQFQTIRSNFWNDLVVGAEEKTQLLRWR